jgi:hypothetical protein
MVIRTEYRGQRYSMGSSDPLPAGFEIRLGRLNFQATGNDYLMRITIHGGRLERDRFPPRLLLAPRHARRQALRALQHLDTDAFLVSAHTRRERNHVGPRAPRPDATHPSTKQRRRPRGSAWLPSRSSPTGYVTLQQPMLRLMAPT